jgi:multiple sugar transport system ATP-binding protein
MANVAFRAITKRFGDTTAVDGLDLEILDHEFLVLLGPSGCGKTTALRMLAGLEEPTSGSITIGETDVTHVDPKDRDIAMVFQSYALYPHMSVAANIEFPLKARKLPAPERELRVREVSQSLGLDGLLGRKPGQLSGGQRQRVALARAIVRRPQVFLMDEPLSNLDAKLRVQTRSELVELQRRLETTTVYVTHDQVEAMTMGHRIAIMRDGKLQQVGAPQEVYDKPANVFVARFIGTPPMNVIDAHVVTDGVSTRVEVGGGSVTLTEGIGNAVMVHTDLRFGIRPEHVQLTSGDGIPARVSVIESLGHERHLLCRLIDNQLIIVRQQAEDPTPNVGDNVVLTATPEHVHCFDPVTDERVCE